MRALLILLAAAAVTFSARAEEKAAPRKSVPIAGGWLLTAEKHEKTKTEGTRTLLLTAKGSPTLKRASKVIGGKADVVAKADRIEVDFEAKKLILRGSPELAELDPKNRAAVKTIKGEEAAVIEVPLRYGEPGAAIKVDGPHKVKLGDAVK